MARHFEAPAGWNLLIVMACSGALVFGTALTTAAASGSTQTGTVVAVILAFVAGPLLVRLGNWLFPLFELYDDKPRRRRFALGAVTAVVLPFVFLILGLVLQG